MVGGLASLISSVVAPETVYLALVSVAGFAVVGVWMSITASHFFHRRAFVRNGGDVSALAYKAPLFPLVPILAFSLCVISLIGIALTRTRSPPSTSAFPFVAACYAFFHFRYGRKAVLQVRRSRRGRRRLPAEVRRHLAGPVSPSGLRRVRRPPARP